MTKRRKWMLILATLLIVAGIAVRVVGEPTLVRFPLNINQKLVYTGTATVYVNPATGQPLATPLTVPLTVDRQVRVVRGGYSTAVINETDAITFAGTTRTETYQFVMDRRSMKLISGPQTFAFNNAASVMSTNGSYRINFPMGTSSSHSYTLWAPQTNSTVVGTPTGPAHNDPVSGTKVVTFSTRLDHPVAPYYQSFLYRQGMPAQLSSATVKQELQAHGANLAAVVAAVAPHLSQAQLQDLNSALNQPVPLVYSYFAEGQVSVEPSTGAVVNASSTREGVSVAPNLSGATTAQAILAPYANLAPVQQLAKALTALAAPQTVLQMSYSETQASARSAASTAKHLASTAALIRWQLPLVLTVLGLLLLIGAFVWRPRSPADVHRLSPVETERKAA